MDRPFLLIAISLSLARFIHGAYKPCADQWRYYAADHVCIRTEYFPLNYNSSRNLCKRLDEGGDLAIIKTKDKQKAINDMDTFKSKQSWIGVRDSDSDGKYHYLDKTEVGPAQGLGDWESLTVTILYECVFLDDTGWGTASCSAKYHQTCEIDLVKKEKKALESCKRSSWEYYTKGDRYFKLFPYPRIFAEADTICKDIDAELAEVNNAGIQKFIKDLDHFGEKPAWIGLRRETPLLIWKWTDGTTLNDGGSFRDWEEAAERDKNCVTTSNPKPSWSARRCAEKHWLICVAKKPCLAKPALTVNKGDHLTGTVTLTGKKEVTIECFATAFKEGVTGVKLTCSWGGKKQFNGKLTTSANYEIDINAHTEKCTCRATSDDSSFEDASFTINWETKPLLKEKGYKTKTHEVEQGGHLFLEFEVFMNPELEKISLMKNGKKVEGGDDGGNSVAVDDIRESKFSRVTLTMPEVDLPDAGDYVLRIDNGMDETLDYGYKLIVLQGSSIPTISIDDEEPSNETVVIDGKKTIRMKCFPRGLTARIKEATLTCTWDKENPSTGQLSVTLTVEVDFTYNREMCGCRMTFRDESYEEFMITIAFHTSPFLENDEYEVETHNVVVGGEVLVQFMAFINPEAKSVEVIRNGTEVTHHAYDIFLDIIPDSKLYRVTLFMSNVHLYYNGLHTLSLNNGLGSLEFKFILNITEVEERTPFNHRYTLGFLILNFLMLVVVMLMCLLISWLICKGGRRKDSLDNQLSYTSASTYADEAGDDDSHYKFDLMIPSGSKDPLHDQSRPEIRNSEDAVDAPTPNRFTRAEREREGTCVDSILFLRGIVTSGDSRGREMGILTRVDSRIIRDSKSESTESIYGSTLSEEV